MLTLVSGLAKATARHAARASRRAADFIVVMESGSGWLLRPEPAPYLRAAKGSDRPLEMQAPVITVSIATSVATHLVLGLLENGS